ncbi:MAG: alanine/glycine:cation symporter family protein, partial [Nannocystaceae bacterium]
WVVGRGLKNRKLGRFVGILFCITLLISTITGGNMFQAWNVGVVTRDGLGVPEQAVGVVLAILVGLTILGGIKRIGAVAGRVVPVMCAVYLTAAFYVLVLNIEALPGLLRLIVESAFNPAEAQGAFVGATFGLAFLWGMKRALFSSEAGQGSSPIAHSAAKTHEPVREGVVAGLEPFIDTIVVATLTSLVILSSGAWNRSGASQFTQVPSFVQGADGWDLPDTPLPPKTAESEAISGPWQAGESVFLIAQYGTQSEDTGTDLHRVSGEIQETKGVLTVDWAPVEATNAPTVAQPDIYRDYVGAALTSHAFDRVAPGLGKWLVLVSSWLFAVSTMISWSYYGEQGVVYIAGEWAVLPYKLFYCLCILVACGGFITTETELDNLTALGTGVMLWVNIPIMVVFGVVAMKAYRQYINKLKAGDFNKS